jgi:hypothetical protein
MHYAGIWYDQRGTTLRIDSLANNLFHGTYRHISPPPAPDPDAPSPVDIDLACPSTLSGSAASPGGSAAPSSNDHVRDLGWFITWINQDGDPVATTSWSGCYERRDGQETITATWYQFTDAVVPDWASTRTGLDTFTRHYPAD